jgi:4-hydroxybenzoate polyprenyltransferase
MIAPNYILNVGILFFLGSVLMRSAGCIINDLCDVKFDEKVARTKIRPLAAKEISKFNALVFLGILLIFGLAILLQFNFKTILGGFFAMILVCTYPLMKRITYYPQIFLGLTFNFGVILSSLALLNEITFSALILYSSLVIWTLIYDTIYAFQDIEDDLKIGVKSSAIAFQKNPKAILNILNLLMFALLIFLGIQENFNLVFFALIFLSNAILAYKITSCDFKNSANCLLVFKQNVAIGMLIAAAILIA